MPVAICPQAVATTHDNFLAQLEQLVRSRLGAFFSTASPSCICVSLAAASCICTASFHPSHTIWHPTQDPIFPTEPGDLAVSYLPAWHAYGRTLE